MTICTIQGFNLWILWHFYQSWNKIPNPLKSKDTLPLTQRSLRQALWVLFSSQLNVGVLVFKAKPCHAAEEEADLRRTISMSWYCSHYHAVKWVEPELWQGQVDRHQEKWMCDFIPLCHIQWKFKSCCCHALWRVLTPAFKVLARLAETQWLLQMVAWRLRCVQHGGTASISTGKLAHIFLAWGDPAQQCTWSGQEQVSRLCAMPLGVLMDIRIIWHVFKERKRPRQSCSFTHGYERRHFYNHKSNPKQIPKL